MGIACVTVYSTADEDALHTRLADYAYHIGPAASQESYLNQSKILAIAKEAACDAIHPGYGFLSENAEFAKGRAPNSNSRYRVAAPPQLQAGGSPVG